MIDSNFLTFFDKRWFQNSVLRWAKVHGRHEFPWQAPHSPYKTWISEIMLQQTQTQRVIYFFNRFMEVFPDPKALAAAQEDQVYHLWSGLGYYTRAQNLLKTAKIMVEQYQGEVPSDLDKLIALPGIGRSTAGAIRSLGHGLEGEILDGNVRRVLGRFATIEGKPQSNAMEQQYWSLVNYITPHKPLRDRAFNQAMMDLGATICTIKNPACDLCPLQSKCLAYHSRQTDSFPITMAKYKKNAQQVQKTRRSEERFYLFLQNGDEVLLEKRPPFGIWRNLWCPMEFQTFDELQRYLEKNLKQSLQNEFQKSRQALRENDAALEKLPVVYHQFSHFDLTLNAYVAKVSPSFKKKLLQNIYEPGATETSRFIWYNMENPPDVGLASPVIKLLNAAFTPS